MTQPIAAPARKTLGTRMGTSAKTLHRKAMEKAAAASAPEGESLEALFPNASIAPGDARLPNGIAMPDAKAGLAALPCELSTSGAAAKPLFDSVGGSGANEQADLPSISLPSTVAEDQPEPAAPEQPEGQSSWSNADEKAYQALLARRKLAGFQRRGRDVSGQRIAVGAIKPNPGTVVADIVGLVTERGPIGRGELLDLMATAAFAHPKGKGGDRAWSQGYVSGAIASGFLQLVAEGSALGEVSPNRPS
ncbi:hypothetical protein [Sphingobium yanoikuyae]|uniref:hypothetical protein n=2 Tax=Sphingobium yanoikuyae TaxID=13690 RepID=UPI000A8EE2AF|nr:hypothetical protein [Sphingobium yanoikuyae]